MSLLAAGLAAVFAWAAVAKLRRRDATAASFAAAGLPAPAGLAVAVPVGELALAALLLASPLAGATLALAALAGFTTQLVLARRRGVATGCGCFGGAGSSAPGLELARNAALATVALTVIVTA
ncbi:MAG: MauE/DoxX family redox-associated membrane protein [Acidimicrobiia bacterium]